MPKVLFLYTYERRTESVSSCCPANAAKRSRRSFFRELLLFFARDVKDDVTLIHHDEAVSVGDRVFHVVGDHECREAVLLNDLVGELQDLCRRRRVERRRVLI